MGNLNINCFLFNLISSHLLLSVLMYDFKPLLSEIHRKILHIKLVTRISSSLVFLSCRVLLHVQSMLRKRKVYYYL